MCGRLHSTSTTTGQPPTLGESVLGTVSGFGGLRAVHVREVFVQLPLWYDHPFLPHAARPGENVGQRKRDVGFDTCVEDPDPPDLGRREIEIDTPDGDRAHAASVRREKDKIVGRGHDST
jgi:hypothetical protein